MTKSTELARAAAPAKALRGSPFGNLLSEDATAAREHGRATARVGVDAAGNPVVYSTDAHTRETVVAAIERRTNVGYCDIPEVTAVQFEKLLREGGRALVQSSDAAPFDDEPADLESSNGAPRSTADEPFVLRIRSGRAVVYEAGPFERVTEAMDARDEWGAAEQGMTATIYEGSRVAKYRGGSAAFKRGRSKWNRAV
jgi:uncharacterized protein YdbL (DUF1318 family)